MITGGFELFAFFAGLVGLMFWLATLPPLQIIFKYIPPVVWVYILPSVASTLGIIPTSHDIYDTMKYYLLPMSLFLLTVTVDVKAILSLGKPALIMMLTGTLGIVIGAPLAYLIFASALPESAWQSIASLTGTWIGGSANMITVQQSLNAPDSILGPIIIVDSVVGYGWMAILLAFSGFQKKLDDRIGADRKTLDNLHQTMIQMDESRKPITLSNAAIIIALGVVAAAVSRYLSLDMPDVGNPTIISKTTWTVLIVVTVGLLLSRTKMRNIEQSGASSIGYVTLYIMFSCVGASADLSQLLDAPAFLLAGITILLVHIGLLFMVAKLIKAPAFLIATGSMANVGGALSAPVVAGSYMPSMAPVGVLMAVAGYIVGIYASLGAAKILATLAF